MNTAVYIIFALTYVLIASRRLRVLPIGRPAGALLGAVLMVAVGALAPQESYGAVDGNTIVLLFGMMILTAYLERAEFFRWATAKILLRVRTPWGLLWRLSLLSGVLSAFLVNDAVCLFLTPVVVSVCTTAGLPLGPYLIGLATSANIGSAATLVGNPQNMIIGSLSGFPFTEFLLYAGPAAGVGLLINIALLRRYYGQRLPAAFAANAEAGNTVALSRSLAFVLLVVALVVVGFFAGFHLGYTTLAGSLVLIIADRREPREAFARVDWSLLVFFSCLFVVVEGLDRTGLVERAWSGTMPYLSLHRPDGLAVFSGLMTLGSNLVSNVPMVLLIGPRLGELGPERTGWILLAFTTTVAGNFTLIGSVANIIVAEGAKSRYTLGFFEYLRFGLISTLLVLAAGVTLLRLLLP
jgi:Na+/H+ antiporter NhaD/arsenite permease-like protein